MNAWLNIENLSKGRNGKDVSEHVRSAMASKPQTLEQRRDLQLRLWYLTEAEVPFWRSVEERLPTLYRVALFVFGEVDSSGFVERVFSTGKNVLGLDRSSLSFECFNDLVFLKHNTDFRANGAHASDLAELLQQVEEDMVACAMEK